MVGSANLDIVTPVPRHPVAGETVLGGDHRQVPGGKGANQAVAAARLGHSVLLIGRIGDDAPGQTLRSSLLDAGVQLEYLLVTPDTPSGIATIAVGPDGDNSIVVSPGANGRVTPDDVAAAADVLAAATVTLLQLEVPLDAVMAAANAATGIVILNPAPAAELPAGLLEQVDILVPNQTELAFLTGGEEPQTPEQAAELAMTLPNHHVVVTLGAAGALHVTGDSYTHIPAPQVSPVDTTAAGDAFCGALAGVIANGGDLQTAIEWAVQVGSVTTLRAGAQPSLPTRSEVEQMLA